MHEKRKLLIRKLLWTVLLLIGIVVPIIIANLPAKDVEFIDDNVFINNYYEYTDTTTCEIEVTFSDTVESGHITVAFYNNNRLLATEEGYLYGYGATLSCTFYSVNGKVDSYEIVDCTANVPNIFDSVIYFYSILIADIVIFAFFIGALLLSCKIYYYYGLKILVYSGWYHHYIKVDGYKVDEHNTIISFSPIYLSAVLEDGTTLEATITMTNRISLKINGRLRQRSY